MQRREASALLLSFLYPPDNSLQAPFAEPEWMVGTTQPQERRSTGITRTPVTTV